jgi:hypothetical protein
MVTGLRKSDPRAVSSLSAKAKAKAKKAKVTQGGVKVVNGAVCVKSSKAVLSTVRPSVTAMRVEKLNELNEFLIKNPDRILSLLRYWKNPENLRRRSLGGRLKAWQTIARRESIGRRSRVAGLELGRRSRAE